MKTFFNGLLMGWREILSHPGRSFLTMLGIILGVTALVSTISIVSGMFQMAEEQLKQTGGLSKLMIENSEPPASQQGIKRYSKKLTMMDAEVIRQTVHGVDLIGPEANEYKYIARANGNEYRSRMKGVVPDYFELNVYDLKDGRFLTDEDVRNAAQVVVLAHDASTELFPGRLSVVGEQLVIGRVPFTVVGVMRNYHMESQNESGRKGNALRWKNRGVFVPVTTVQRRFPSNDQRLTPTSVDSISVRVANLDDIESVVAQINNALTSTHNGVLDFEVKTNEEGVEQAREMRKTYYTAMGGVAGISLVIGGIGIMNVMLASISERIREIGIRKAVGATNMNVFVQVLAEAVTLSLIGGLIGMISSVFSVGLLGKILSGSKLEPTISFDAMLFGFAFSVVVGVVSGLYPALKAARLDPIDALRYE